MRKATFLPHRFQLEFGITEENEDEVRAEQEDNSTPQPQVQQDSTGNPISPLITTDELTQSILECSPQEWRKITVISSPAMAGPLQLGIPPPLRRQTMPELSSDQLPSIVNGKASFSKPIDVPSTRRPRITNAAISSSIGPSIAGIFPGAPSNLFLSGVQDSSSTSELLVSSLRRSSTFSSLNEPLNLEEAAKDARGRRWSSRLPFLRALQHQDSNESSTTENSGSQLIDQQHRSKYHHHHHHHHHRHGLPHLHVPHFSITGPSSEGSGSGTGRKFSFGIRRHSHTVGPRTTSSEFAEIIKQRACIGSTG